MKTLIDKIKTAVLAASSLALFASCDNDSVYSGEMYRKVLYLLSNSNNVYTEVYTLNEDEPVKYLSIGCGGSLANEEEIEITLEYDTVLLAKYNKSNFDDTASYARTLPSKHYDIPSMTAVFPAHSPEQYIKVPIRVRPEGLSPDSTYFIPLAIKSVSRYEINPEKRNVLYHVTIENDYARQKTTTYYQMKGISTPYGSNRETAIAGTKPVKPLTRNRVRLFAGGNLQTNSSTAKDIGKYSIIAQVNDDNSITVLPYSTIETVQMSHPNYNRYAVEGKERYFYLYYRYRTLTTPATDTTPAVWSAWIEVKETLRRLE